MKTGYDHIGNSLAFARQKFMARMSKLGFVYNKDKKEYELPSEQPAPAEAPANEQKQEEKPANENKPADEPQSGKQTKGAKAGK